MKPRRQIRSGVYTRAQHPAGPRRSIVQKITTDFAKPYGLSSGCAAGASHILHSSKVSNLEGADPKWKLGGSFTRFDEMVFALNSKFENSSIQGFVDPIFDWVATNDVKFIGMLLICWSLFAVHRGHSAAVFIGAAIVIAIAPGYKIGFYGGISLGYYFLHWTKGNEVPIAGVCVAGFLVYNGI